MAKLLPIAIFFSAGLITLLFVLARYSVAPSSVFPPSYPPVAKSRLVVPRTVKFVGDMMFARGVDTLIRRHGSTYPLVRIEPFLRGTDVVVGNLEGPIVLAPVLVAPDSLRFNFPSETAKSLAWADFSLVSLANNHTLDRGTPGLDQTRQFLTANGISAIGNPLTCVEEAETVIKDVVFLAFNTTFPSGCQPEKLSSTVSLIRLQSPDKFIAVMLHWGEEYRPASSRFQQDLGHRLIDAGADVIIGHHPHVVQEIEVYQGKPIFYSLGNFIFDQYFSADTQIGLAIGAEIYPDSVVYRLFPLDLSGSQPQLMPVGQQPNFFSQLAARSSPDLFKEIVSGVLILNR